MLVCLLSVLGSSVVMLVLDPESHWALHAHVFTGIVIAAVLVVAFGCLLEVPPFVRRR
jgi:hypothetical protein